MIHSSGEPANSDTGNDVSLAEVRHEAVHFEKERGVTEIRILRGVAHATVQLAETDIGGGRLQVLQTLAVSSVPVFLVKLLPDGLSFAIRGESVEACDTALKQIEVTFKLIHDLSVVTTIAGAMRDLSGIMAAIYETLNEVGIRVQQTGDAYNAVLCLVDGSRSDEAARVLRKRFSLDDSAIAAKDAQGIESEKETEVPGAGLKAL
jgi:aspartokinase